MSDNIRIFLMIAVISTVTVTIRFLPFIIFKNSVPEPIEYLGRVLPYAIMGMLVVYCLKNVSVLEPPYGIPEALSLFAVIALHKLKHNTLISIVAGTVLYMVLVQLVF